MMICVAGRNKVSAADRAAATRVSDMGTVAGQGEGRFGKHGEYQQHRQNGRNDFFASRFVHFIRPFLQSLLHKKRADLFQSAPCGFHISFISPVPR